MERIVQHGIGAYNLLLNYDLWDIHTAVPMPPLVALNMPIEYGDWNPFRYLLVNTYGSESNLFATLQIRDYAVLMMQLARNKLPLDNPMVQELIYQLSRFFVFNQNFILLRRSYMPQAGAGSQQSAYRLHDSLNKLIANHVGLKIKEDDFDEEELE